MKSPDQVGKSTNKPGEGTMKSEKTPQEPKYDQAKWEKLKQGFPAPAIIKGREMGVPGEELDRFAEDVIARKTKNQEYEIIYQFRKNLGIGTGEEIRAAGETAYQFLLKIEAYGAAMEMAGDVYGRGSEEWKRANEACETKQGEKHEEREIYVTLSKDATFADLFSAIGKIEDKEGLGKFHFEEELWDNFDAGVVEEVLSFRYDQKDKSATTKVINFFKARGYTQSDVSTFLPIKFEKRS